VRIVSVVGARPQFVKAAPVSAALAGRVDEVMIHTGQHYDPEMSDTFFAELGLAEPLHHLGAGSGSHAEQTARILTGVERVLQDDRPDAVLVYGDTNSTIAAALAAAKLHVPVAHVEAGLRSFDRGMPEELNRVVTDHLSSLLFAPSPVAVDNLRAEGVTSGVHMVGDVMVDALLRARDRVAVPHPVATALGLRAGEYAVATVHRAATTDDPARLRLAVELLSRLELPVIFAVHPRTRGALERAGLLDGMERGESSVVHLLPPVSYLTMIGLMAGARAVLTDSGGMQKEAYLLGTPCVTLRDQTEWVETVEAGWNTLVGLDAARARAALASRAPLERPELYGDGHAAERIVDALLAGC
jgi:UDP-N-acetylglucosamine 2-epimerase